MHIDEARIIASEILKGKGWTQPDGVEWIAPAGRRGVLVYTPDLDADPNGLTISKVEIRHPNTEDGRIPPFTHVVSFETLEV